MNKDKEIEDLFKGFNPEVDTEHVMTEISDKMDVIDTVRPEQERMNRFHKTVSACCFIVGLLSGCFLMSIVMFHPSAENVVMDFISPDNRYPELALFCTDHRDLILTFLAAASFILGSLPLIYTNEWSKSV